MRGYIDALAAWDDELWVLDYKSDVLPATGDLAAAARARVAEHYAVQARIYGLAADRLRGRRKLAGLLYAFVRYGVVAAVPDGDGAIAEYTSWLAEIPA